ncbi:THUMP domain-containing class I SAM-dependent RNA methyltransferase [Alkalibacter mobilis]|uniref:THUMP domain-containing class I SAM-dependent RNA methyltransferase n=1 Tax=Alkalibacter mobilis TaxID=2787712 RepID=UPI00189FE444|nr:class I SAM-dependent RNA methyltransferase [Alkalibacter mobilis]MBF7096013.1 class I SAM-dependent RNA methyltransferase [Alkalibacter mobilis]
MNDKFILAATCTFGLEGVLKKELQNLGYDKPKADNGKVYFEGTVRDVAMANISLRTADRVLIQVGSFECLTFEELYERTKSLPWEKWIGEKDIFPVAKSISVKSKLFSRSDCQRIVKKAVADRLGKKYKTQWLEESGATVAIHLNILKDQASLFLDTSGSGLNKRGYRAKGNEAPIKETLAAAMVLLSGWRPELEFLDPFCGSGTIPIEAAMLALDIKPGMKRDFASQDWKGGFAEAFDEIRSELQHSGGISKKSKLFIEGWDLDGGSIETAKENARLAGVGESVVFRVKDARDIRELHGKGMIVSNPPYGERLMEKKEVEALYKDLGRAYKDAKDYSAHIITAHLEFERYFGRRATKNRKLYNGNVLTYFYQFYKAGK